MPATVLRDESALRIDLASFAEELYRQGGVLEIITHAQRGLDASTLDALSASRLQGQRLRRMLRGDTVGYNASGRLVLTRLGRELAFDMFGVGASDR